jgi:DNA-binding transcriptional regulator GbsR (MarR family)
LEANSSEILKKIGMSPSQSAEAIKALNKVPIVDMKWSLVAVDERN